MARLLARREELRGRDVQEQRPGAERLGGLEQRATHGERIFTGAICDQLVESRLRSD